MKKLALCALLGASLASLMSPALQAAQTVDNMGLCMAESTTGRDRKNLAIWIFTSMSAHPELKLISEVPANVTDAANQEVASLITRLLTENCLQQSREVIKTEGQPGLVAAFEILGRLAMQELMSNKDVNSAISAYGKYVDQAKMSAALSSH